jgi:hypothetical protein
MDKIMIKDFFVRIKGPHLFLSLIFLGLGVIVLALGVKEYKEYSQREIRNSETSARQEPNLSPEELQAMFGTSGDPAGDEFEVVAEKNLFSPDREAWEPPPPRDDQVEDKPVRTQRINPKEFKLYGVTFAGDEKTALIYYQRLPESSRNRLVSEGETIYQERNGGDAAFKVVSIEAESVTLEASGDSFEVGLFSHERQVVQKNNQDRISVVIGGTSESIDTASLGGASRPADAASNAEAAGRESRPGSGSQASGSASDQTLPAPDKPEAEESSDEPGEQPQSRGGLPELLQKMREGASQGGQAQDSGDMERQVEEGTMRRVDTPFGPVYRPVQ